MTRWENAAIVLVSWVWNVVQIALAFWLAYFFFWSNADCGDEGAQILWLNVPTEGTLFTVVWLQWNLYAIVGAFAIFYVVIGFVQVGLLPIRDAWIRGANWACSLFVAIPVVWAYISLIKGSISDLTDLQNYILNISLFAALLDLLMIIIVPWSRKAAKKFAEEAKKE